MAETFTETPAERTTDALHDAALDLPLEQQRINHRADIVDHGVARQLDRTERLVDDTPSPHPPEE